MVRLALFIAMSLIAAQTIRAQNELVPLEDLKPLEVGEGVVQKHGYNYGLSAANTMIGDSASLKKGFFLGNYRPFFRYLWNEQHLFTARGRIGYNYNNSLTDTQKTAGVSASTGLYAMELFNAELHFGNHKLTAGRAFYKTGRGLLFANFADGAEYVGQFRYAKVTAMASYSAQYSGCTISLSGCGFSGQVGRREFMMLPPAVPSTPICPMQEKEYSLRSR